MATDEWDMMDEAGEEGHSGAKLVLLNLVFGYFPAVFGVKGLLVL
jgi:hypothetical protein